MKINPTWKSKMGVLYFQYSAKTEPYLNLKMLRFSHIVRHRQDSSIQSQLKYKSTVLYINFNVG